MCASTRPVCPSIHAGSPCSVKYWSWQRILCTLKYVWRVALNYPAFFSRVYHLCKSENMLACIAYKYFAIVCCTKVLLKPIQVTRRTVHPQDGFPVCCTPPSVPLTCLTNSPFYHHSCSPAWALTGELPGHQKTSGTTVSGEASLSFAYLVIIGYDRAYQGYSVSPEVFIAKVAVTSSE